MWKEPVVTEVGTLSWYLYGGAEYNQEKVPPSPNHDSLRPRWDYKGTLQARRVIAWANCALSFVGLT
jgi:hypothetical protein